MLKLFKTFASINSKKTRRFLSEKSFDDQKCIKCGFYSKSVEEKINEQIAAELRAAYAYLSMQVHFARADVALGGCEKFFKLSAREETRHAMKLCKYQNFRGGSINLIEIEKPPKFCYTISDAFVSAVDLEKKLTEKLFEVKKTAQQCRDDFTVDYITTEFLGDQFKAIQSLNALVTRLNLLKDNDIGVHLFDQELQKRLKNTKTFLH